MTDKVQKIKDWIKTRKLCTMDEHMKFYCKEAESDYNLLCSIEKILDSIEGESVSDEQVKESAKVKHINEMCKENGNSLTQEPVSEDIQKVGSLKSLEYYPEKKTTNKTSKGVFDANIPRRKAYQRGFKDGAHAHKELIANKPVSEDLEEAIGEYCSNPDNFATWIGGDETDDIRLIIKAIEFGAQWKEQQLMAKAVKVNISNASIVSLPVNCDLKVGDKVLIIKED